MLLAVLSVLLIFHSSRSEDTLDVIDDADLRILYSGSWVSYTGLNDSMNWAGTVTYSNTSGATANLTFVGDSVGVFGAFTPVGTYNMRSQYFLDDSPPVVFSPPSVIQKEEYRHQFYFSGPIPLGVHTIRVENLGEQFWLDSIQVTRPQNVSSVLPTTGAATSSSVMPTHDSSGSQGSSPTSTASQTSGTVEGGQGGQQYGSPRSSVVVPAVIAGVVVAVVVSLLFLAIGGLLWCRYRRKQRAKVVPTPFDGVDGESMARMKEHREEDTVQSQPASLMFTPPTSSTGRGTIHGSSIAEESLAAGPAEQGDDAAAPSVKGSRAPRTSQRSTPSLTMSGRGPRPPRTESSSSVRDSPVPGAGSRTPPVAARTTNRRQSLDGGMRIAGGPPGQEVDFPEVEAMSTASTLPPMYQTYGSH
ncbi:hypothetical protein ONZ51_g8416 [Trametes cubensis]|uniref:Mid2 domain-containing protein n=1 Tax=Trametes cubensis TaxID=1111947 RepID=A0AAD7TQP4_9APHY|nr:hypothetical protein ONZ51_g8416 [Trametes cubensis]